MPYIGVSPFNGVRKKHTYTATASQTSFSGAGAEGITLSYKDSTFVDVFQNGVKLGEADYTSTSGTAIVLAQGASLNDIVEVVVYDVFSVADTVSKADGGTFDGNVTMAGTLDVTGAITSSAGATITTADNTSQLTLTSTDADANVGPALDLFRDSSSPADGDSVGKILFHAENDAGEKILYGSLMGIISDASDGTEDGAIRLAVLSNGSEANVDFTAGGFTTAGPVTMSSSLSAKGGAVFNEDSADVDFRVESNSNANMLFVDGGNDRVYIGKDDTTAGSTFNAKLQIEDTGAAAGIAIHRGNAGTGQGYLNFSKSRAATIGDVTVVQDGDSLGAVIWSGADGTDRATPAAQIHAVVDGTPGSNDMPGKIIFSTTKDGASSVSEYFRLMSNGRLEFQSVTNDGNVLQQQRLDWRNENNAGIMAGIGVVRTANGNAPGAFVIRTSTNVDSSSNDSDGEISEKFRVAANGDLTATDTSIASNSDSRLKENISDFAYDLDKFKALKTKTFDWKNPKLHGEKSGQRGFVAQDVETVDSYWIEEIEVPKDSDDFQYLEDKDILYTENSTIPDDKKVGDLEYKARFAKTSKLGQKDAMYVSVIQQLITRIETLEAEVKTLKGE